MDNFVGTAEYGTNCRMVDTGRVPSISSWKISTQGKLRNVKGHSFLYVCLCDLVVWWVDRVIDGFAEVKQMTTPEKLPKTITEGKRKREKKNHNQKQIYNTQKKVWADLLLRWSKGWNLKPVPLDKRWLEPTKAAHRRASSSADLRGPRSAGGSGVNNQRQPPCGGAEWHVVLRSLDDGTKADRGRWCFDCDGAYCDALVETRQKRDGRRWVWTERSDAARFQCWLLTGPFFTHDPDPIPSFSISLLPQR